MFNYLKQKIFDFPRLSMRNKYAYIVDTCVFDKILKGEIRKIDLPANGVFLITHVQLDKLNSIPDRKKRAKLLLNLFLLPVQIEQDGVCKKDISRFGYAKASELDSFFCIIKDRLDKKNGGKEDNAKDAVIADTAIRNFYTLISADKDLIEVARKLGCKTFLLPSNEKSSEMLRVCHVTSVHSRYDARIFKKECRSLAKNGYDVFFLVNDCKLDETLDGVKIVSTKFSPNSRMERILVSFWKIKDKALEIDAAIYHLHDPELLPLGIWLKKKGKKVVFDSHEDYLLAILDKPWIPPLIRGTVSKMFELFEAYAIRRFDGAVTCYHWTEKRYRNYCKNIAMVFNFPIVEVGQELPLREFSKRAVCFAGVIIQDWCHKEILQALAELKNVQYELAGRSEGGYFNELKTMTGWQYVNFHGTLSQERVFREVYGKASVGMALLDYVAQCNGKIGNLSNTKFFEYMLMGIPLVCTDFQLWKKIVEEEQCGLCVNPHKPSEIAWAIGFFLDNPKIAKEMGENGYKAVIEKYNWKTEESKLFSLYKKII